MPVETDEQRAKRRSQRVLFDSVAERYDATRRSYPSEIIEFLVATSGVSAGDAVLEIGCGTGQLTRRLAPHRFAITAIDIGPSMIAVAQRKLGAAAVTFEATSFEAFEGRSASYGLVVSATAFHWIDPDVAWTKVARLLRPGGWLALLETGEKYGDPLGSALMELWTSLSPDGGAWAREKKPTFAELVEATGLFDPAIVRSHAEPMTLAADVVLGLEHTRATSLSYDDATRRSFTDRLTALLGSSPEVRLEQQTSLTMAQVKG